MASLARLRALWTDPVYRFVLFFAVCLLALGFGYPWLRTQFYPAFAALERATTALTYALTSPFSSQITRGLFGVTYGEFTVHIVEECTGMYEALIYAAAVLAYPTRWRHKLVGLLVGVPGIYLINLLRIASLLVIGHHAKGQFEFLHIYFWQGTLVVIVASSWLAWLFLVVRRAEAPAAAA
jgi:exosortase H (IPTLxxWG-CTERM-specific)